MFNWIQRLKKGLSQSSSQITQKISGLFQNRHFDQEILQELEDVLIESDIGLATTSALVKAIEARRFSVNTTENDVRKFLAIEMTRLMEPFSQPLIPDLQEGTPWICLVVGVNGSGKTTTIGKLANIWKQQKLQVSLIAGDTFRAAAVEQLQIWGERSEVPVKIGHANSEAAALIFEGLDESQKRGDQVVLIDTSGRLHNKKHLMDELKKIVRVIQKQFPKAPHSCVLVLDGTTGQNSWSQVQVFQEAIPLTGLIVTKLDGTARGGSVVGLLGKHQLPLHAIGVGEAIEDLQPFNPKIFANHLMGFE